MGATIWCLLRQIARGTHNSSCLGQPTGWHRNKLCLQGTSNNPKNHVLNDWTHDLTRPCAASHGNKCLLLSNGQLRRQCNVGSKTFFELFKNMNYRIFLENVLFLITNNVFKKDQIWNNIIFRRHEPFIKTWTFYSLWPTFGNGICFEHSKQIYKICFQNAYIILNLLTFC